MSDTNTTQDGTEGKRVRRVLTMKNFTTPEWVLQNVVAKGKGTAVKVGRVYGVATEVKKRTNEVNGKPVESIAVIGTFEGVRLDTGETTNATTVYFPMAYAEQVAATLVDPAVTMLQIDVDIGVEATGKAIPYEWTVTAFLSEREASVLTMLRNRRQARLAAPAPAPAEALAPAEPPAEPPAEASGHRRRPAA